MWRRRSWRSPARDHLDGDWRSTTDIPIDPGREHPDFLVHVRRWQVELDDTARLLDDTLQLVAVVDAVLNLSDVAVNIQSKPERYPRDPPAGRYGREAGRARLDLDRPECGVLACAVFRICLVESTRAKNLKDEIHGFHQSHHIRPIRE
jgi:hypothetical protein